VGLEELVSRISAGDADVASSRGMDWVDGGSVERKGGE
jgi:hypothetical protein